jgi:hypothetical protein
MSRNARWRHKGRQEGGSFAAIPHALMDSPNWQRCSGTAIKLLCELARQFNGHNNGDLCAALSVLKPRGWTSADVVSWGLRELRHYGLIVLTRQGGLHAASLYALTWHPINECSGKRLELAPTRLATGEWKEQRPAFKRPLRNRGASPLSGATPIRHPEHKAA